jgi:hypothetical protein
LIGKRSGIGRDSKISIPILMVTLLLFLLWVSLSPIMVYAPPFGGGRGIGERSGDYFKGEPLSGHTTTLTEGGPRDQLASAGSGQQYGYMQGSTILVEPRRSQFAEPTRDRFAEPTRDRFAEPTRDRFAEPTTDRLSPADKAIFDYVQSRGTSKPLEDRAVFVTEMVPKAIEATSNTQIDFLLKYMAKAVIFLKYVVP